MKKIIWIIFILIVAAFGAGIYFKDDAIKLYESLNNQIKDFQKSDVGNLIAETAKEIISPPPLQVKRKEQQVSLLKSGVILETNLQRQQNGLPALKENVKLDAAALAKANDMFKNQYFEHVSLSGVDPGKLVQNYGYEYILAGENLILGNFSSEKEVVQDWMDSPGHRANILNNRYTEIGTAIIKGTYKGEPVWIGVQEFGLPLSFCAQPREALKTEIDTNKAQLEIMANQIDERKQQINDTNHNSAAYSQMVDDYNRLVESYNSLVETTKQLVAQYNEQVNNFNACVNGSQ